MAELDAVKIGDQRSKPVSYLKWDKVTAQQKKNTDAVRQEVKRVTTSGKAELVAQLMGDSYIVLKEHLLRDMEIKRYMKLLRTRVLNTTDEAVIHVDWAENYALQTIREVQAAYFTDTTVSIHTGYCYSKQECFGFASLSDSGDHKAEVEIFTVFAVLHCALYRLFMLPSAPCLRASPARASRLSGWGRMAPSRSTATARTPTC